MRLVIFSQAAISSQDLLSALKGPRNVLVLSGLKVTFLFLCPQPASLFPGPSHTPTVSERASISAAGLCLSPAVFFLLLFSPLPQPSFPLLWMWLCETWVPTKVTFTYFIHLFYSLPRHPMYFLQSSFDDLRYSSIVTFLYWTHSRM